MIVQSVNLPGCRAAIFAAKPVINQTRESVVQIADRLHDRFVTPETTGIRFKTRHSIFRTSKDEFQSAVTSDQLDHLSRALLKVNDSVDLCVPNLLTTFKALG